VNFTLRLFVAMVAGIAMFLICLVIPLFVISALRGDPGNIAGGILTIFVGFPIGFLGGLFSGIFAFRKIDFSK
jgi:hypothetical protein